jgi:gliding motility-associated-like protein
MNRISLVIFSFLALVSIKVSSQPDWFEQTVPVSNDLYDIEFVSINIGYATGVGGKILKTTNGGYTWLEQNSGTTLTLFDCEFESELIGWVCGAGGLVLRTTNGGETWTPKVILPVDEFHAMHFFTNTYGYVAGKNTSTGFAEIYYTIDGGITFTGISPPAGMTNITDLVFANLNQGLVMDQWNIYYTTNAGMNWTPTAVGTSFAMNRIQIFNATTGWLVGDQGTIFFTGTSGATWTAQNSGVTANLYGISVVDVNTVYVCGDGGLVMKSIDGGVTWTEQTTSVTTALKAISAVDGDNGWACGIGPKIVRSMTDLDLELAAYAGPTNVCLNQPFMISVILKNVGSYTIDSGTITVLDGISSIITYNLTTPIPAGQSLTLDLGLHSVNFNSILTINYDGDDLDDNNALLHPISVITDVAYGITGPTSSCIGENINMQAFGGLEYYWFNASSDSSSQTQSLVFYEATNYVVKITQANCVVFDTLEVAVGSGSCTTSAFSPNADGKNDFFHIDNLPLGENSVTIYNRWGDELITLQNYDNVTVYWNGDDAYLKPLVEGVYFYVVESKSTGPFSEGWVSLVR